ncbi:MAG: hypothetical protein II984_02025 [Clostridia bacterium]|nr:hypothetical protein [Clostridia bacterium]
MKKKEAIHTYEYPFPKAQLTESIKDKLGKYGNNEYLIEYKENGNFFLGVERAGHSGGNWYVANVTEADGKTTITGKIVYNPDENGQETKLETSKSEKIGTVLLCIFFGIPILFILLLFSTVLLFEKIINKFRKKPKLTFLSKEEKLDKFMLEYLNCKKL